MLGVGNSVRVDINFTVLTVPTRLYCIESGRGVKGCAFVHSATLHFLSLLIFT